VEAALLRHAYVGMIGVAVAAACAAGCGLGSVSSVARGRELFEGCSPCHGQRGEGSLAHRAPAIGGLPDWYVAAELNKFKTNVRGAHPDDDEGHRMRPMARSLYRKGDLEAVTQYVASLTPTRATPVLAGDAVAGGKQYSTICIACHGPDGRGNQGLGAPPLVNQADWYMLAQLKKFKTGMRGAHRDDITGSQMRAMSSTLQDTVAMRDVVAYIKTLAQ
jgi:cytochrome c oxidase subunit 2